ncbi:zinc finger CCCH domain-containing protein 43-like isoform X2 [Juglans microcarpa x Juglans regia]|uniref:zinc finger CCCH domain-containing protein 43-like isoform X2 n=1 Tax=Juglans microcarpa x Juglans regia TaxID=2249226 RepID=UPI001B7E45AB|nr:zinc finger CCCH domain-containing protein 43-like isoform X2 [Juglans microcarpa x Juglans regia]
MEASESIYVASPKIKDPEVGFQSLDSPNPDLDHARSDTSNTAEEQTAFVYEKFQQLVLKEQWEPAPKDEDEKDRNWGLKEAEDGQEAEKGKGGSHLEEAKAGESEWNGWGDNGNDNGVVIDVVVVEEGSEAEDGSERYGGTDTKRHQYQYPVRPEAEDCAFYLKTGTCKFGSNCRFNHPVRRKNQYYMRSGGCKYGDACKYSHKRDKISGTTLLDLNFLGLPIRPGEKECPFYMRTGSCKYGANCRFNHPDPTAVGGSDNPSGYGNGGSATLDASQSSIASWSSSRKFNETAPFAPIVLTPSHGIPSQNPEWNGLQAPVYLPERSMRPPVTYIMSPAGTETNVYTHHQQQIQVEEYPERPGYPECSYFLKTGDCKYKSNCRYHHPKDRIVKSPPCALSDKGLPLRPDQNICTHYSRYGICKFGPACKFDHPLHPASSPMTGVDQHLPYGDSVTTDKAVGGGIGSEATFRQSL